MGDISSEESEGDSGNEGKEEEKKGPKEGSGAKKSANGIATIDDIPERDGKIKEDHKILLK